MKEATMLFRPGDTEVIWGIPLDTVTVDAHEVEDYLADGWHLHPWHARDAAEAEKLKEPIEQDEQSLEERAKAVGLKIDGRWSPDKLAEKVAEAEEAAKGKE